MHAIETASNEIELDTAYWNYLGTFTRDDPLYWKKIRAAQYACAKRKNEIA